MLTGCGGIYPSESGVTRVTGVTIIGKSLYLFNILHVTPTSHAYLEACNSATWCNASDA